MRIVLMAANGQTSPLHRARVLAEALGRFAEVEVVVPRFAGDPVVPPGLNGLTVRLVAGRTGTGVGRMIAEMADAPPADLYYAVKDRPVSMAAAAEAARRTGAPWVVDVDDDERYLAWPFSRYAAKNLLWSLPRAADPNAYPWVRLAQAGLRPQAAGLSVVSEVFRRRLGGTYVPQGVDTTAFDPAGLDRERLRAALGFSGQRVVVFAGTLLPTKGAAVLADALARSPDPLLRLAVLGPVTACAQALAQADPRVLLLGERPHAVARQVLAAGDAVALPQLDTPFTAGQVPIKLVEAMAMAVPIVASAISDLPAMLDGCGVLVPPGDPVALADALQAVLADPAYAAQLGAAARRRCVAEFSYDALAPRLAGWLGGLLTDRSSSHDLDATLGAPVEASPQAALV